MYEDMVLTDMKFTDLNPDLDLLIVDAQENVALSQFVSRGSASGKQAQSDREKEAKQTST